MKTNDLTTSYVAAKMIRRNPWNRLPTDEAVESMTRSIRDVGVLQPVTARPVPGDDGTDLELVMGERRWAACMRISPDFEVPVVIRHLDEKETAKLLAVENFQRKDLDPVEEARALKHMRETGWDMEQIAEAVGRDRTNVWRTMRVLELPEAGMEAVREGTLSVRAAVAIVGLPAELQERAIADCVTPPTRSRALSQAEALAMLQERYVGPLKAREEWEAKRPAAENEWPTAEWSGYDEALSLGEASSGWEAVMRRPEPWRLSRIYSGDVPTWLELAQRHGGKLRFACVKGEPVPMVDVEPLIDAEKARCAESPAECVFDMRKWEEAEPKSEEEREDRREAAAKGAAANAERIEALRTEHARLCEDVLAGNMAIGSMKALCGFARDRMLAEYEEVLREIFGVKAEGVEGLTKELELEDPDWTAIGRLAATIETAMVAPDGEYLAPALARIFGELLKGKAIKKKDFPTLAKEIEKEGSR